MKKLLLTILISIISITVFSQSCLPEGITFTSQEQIDNFQTDNPGCTEIEGDLYITGEDIVDLNGLDVLTSIGGYLWINGNSDLTSLEGLDGINSILGNLRVENNNALTNLMGLEGITNIGGMLHIKNNYTLISLMGLEGLTSIGTELMINNNDNLASLTGLEGLIYLGESINIGGNYLLNNLEALDGLAGSIGSLMITHNDFLSTLTGLEGLTSVETVLWIKNNNALTSLTGLEEITSIGQLWIVDNPVLTSLDGLEGTNFIGELMIDDNDALSNLIGLDGVTSIEGHIIIGGNDDLNSLEGLENIDANSIESIEIGYNSHLSTCEVQSICDYLVIPNGDISIDNNAPGCNSQEEVEEACETVSIDENSSIGSISTSPNPFTTSTTIEYELQQPEKVSLNIYNHLGQLVYQTEKHQSKGNQQLIWNAEGYSDGIYYYRLQVVDAVANGKMVKVR